ncbi:B3 domain-containing transcription factor VRN1-like [Helianthus annuus]|uniref:B3 domain-containing transcription factor VRN1-like n=1 Tax=Helianthus annuus TaxID=4232 RepID=UPI000B8F67D4|nr:B3 domain-containing transcription factor VRN1-like [Helianthus annuus]
MKNKPPNMSVQLSAGEGHTWELKIEKRGRRYYLTDGWMNVIKDMQLKFGYILVFDIIQNPKLTMTVFHPDGSEFIIPKKNLLNKRKRTRITKDATSKHHHLLQTTAHLKRLPQRNSSSQMKLLKRRKLLRHAL